MESTPVLAEFEGVEQPCGEDSKVAIGGEVKIIPVLVHSEQQNYQVIFVRRRNNNVKLPNEGAELTCGTAQLISGIFSPVRL
jgi:hypothetical protein